MSEPRFVAIRGNAHDRGKQYGRECRELIQHATFDVLPAFLAERTGVDRAQSVQTAAEYAEDIERFSPEIAAEIAGMAEGASISYGDALLLQLRAELSRFLAAPDPECTSIGVSAARSATAGALLGQNIDMDPSLHELGMVLQVDRQEGPSVLAWTLAGTFGQTGINSAGLARCGNVVVSPGWRIGVPTSLLFRLLLDQPSIESALGLLRDVPRAKGNNVLLADRSGAVVDIEMTVDRDAVLDTAGVVCHTNHFLAAEFTDVERFAYLDDSQARLRRLEELVSETPGLLDVSALQRFLSDRGDAAHPICVEESANAITIASVIGDPAAGEIHVAFGPPATHSFHTYSF